MEVIIALIVVIIIGVFIYSMVWPPDCPWSPWWRTSRTIARRQFALAKVSKHDIVYDLGSGEGLALIVAAKEFGVGKCVGVEIDPLRYYYSQIVIFVKRLQKKVHIYRKSFFDTDLSEATVVVMFLIPQTMARLRPKLLNELKPGTKVITYVYKIDLPMIAKDEENEVYVYKIPQKK